LGASRSAWKLWQNAGHADFRQSGITLGRVLGTTLVNPKALVFAFAIFPPAGFVARLPYLGLFAGLVIVTAVGWMTLGMIAARRSAGLLTSSRVERITAVALAAFAMLLMVQTIESLL
jgi:threonine/homoserine/homoserine lactone efflux protein